VVLWSYVPQSTGFYTRVLGLCHPVAVHAGCLLHVVRAAWQLIIFMLENVPFSLMRQSAANNCKKCYRYNCWDHQQLSKRPLTTVSLSLQDTGTIRALSWASRLTDPLYGAFRNSGGKLLRATVTWTVAWLVAGLFGLPTSLPLSVNCREDTKVRITCI